MNFSEMKVEGINGVKLYLNRNWKRQDMMNLERIPEEVHRTLKQVYLVLFCAMFCSTFGSFMQWISVAGGKFTVFSLVASLIWIYFTPPGRLNVRFLLSMLVAYSFGASVSAFTNYLLNTEQWTCECAALAQIAKSGYNTFTCSVTPLLFLYVLGLLAGITIGIGSLLYKAMITPERSEIYISCRKYCYILMISGIAFILLDRHTALWTITIHTVLILFMGYIVIYSQEILYNANIGHINFNNCMFTVSFHLPGILIHAARLYLQAAEIEEHEV